MASGGNMSVLISWGYMAYTTIGIVYINNHLHLFFIFIGGKKINSTEGLPKMDDQQKRELIGSQQVPVAVIPPEWIERECVVNAIPDVEGECAMALIIGEDLTKGATSWREKCMTPLANVNWFLMYFLILCVEEHKLGSPSVNVSKLANPDTYNRAVKSLARRMAGIEKPTIDDANIKKYIHYLPTINKEHLTDITNMIELVKKEEAERKQKKRKKDEEGGIMAALAAIIPPPPPPPPKRELNLYNELKNDILFEDSNDIVIEKVASEDNMSIPTINGQICSKVSFTVTDVTNANNVTIGYLVRLLVHDEKWNPGRLIYDLSKECEEREKQKGNQFAREPKPQYLHLQGTDFPTHSMSWSRWVSCANYIYGQHDTLQSNLLDISQCSRADNKASMMHPFKVCSLDLALRRLREAGGVVPDKNQFYAGEKIAAFPLRAVKYPSNTVFWDHDKLIGLSGQYFPFALKNSKDFFNADIMRYLNRAGPFSKETIRNMMPQFSSYKTGNMLIHMAVEANLYEDRVKSYEPERLYERYVLYKEGHIMNMEDVAKHQEIMQHYNKIGMRKLCTVLPLEGSAEFAPVPETIKMMLKWIQEYGDQPITRESELYDDQMDLFSNWIAKQMVQYEKFGKIVQTIIPFKLRGCFSVYQLRLIDILLYNLNVFGFQGNGKSFLTVSFLQKFCIPGTFKVIDRLTGAADQTDQSVYDEIRGQHEMDEAFVSAAHGKKHVDKVNMKKSALTSGKLTVKICENQRVAGYGTLRGSRLVEQAQNYTEVNCSNTKPDENAIGSRYHNVLLAESNIPVEQMNYEVETVDKKTIITDFRVTQFLSCMMEKAMSVYAVPCRAPFMGLFDDISTRMMDALRAWGAMSDDLATNRALDVMKPMARELTIEKAMLLTFHVKGAVHYGKKYEHHLLVDAAPLAYTDSNIVLLTWTLHSSDWIKSDYGNVLNAMWKLATSTEWSNKKSMYEYYQEDYDGKIHFKTFKNLLYDQKTDNGKNKFEVDLNEIEILGSLSEISRAVSEITNPKLKPSDVKAIMVAMTEKSFRPRTGANQRNGYARKLLSDDLKQHKGIITKKKELTIMGYKDTLSSYCNEYHVVILKNNYPEDEVYSEVKAKCMSPMDEMLVYLGKPTSYPDPGKMELIVKSFLGVREDQIIDVYNTIPNLTPGDCAIILHGFEKGVFKKRGDTKNTFIKVGIKYDKDNIEFPRHYCESDIPMLNGFSESDLEKPGFKHQMINLVNVYDKKKVTFSPMAIELFDKNIVLDAFIDATLCATTQAGKKMLGWVHDEDPSKFQTVNLTQEMINTKVKEMDNDCPQGGTMRVNGIPFIRRGFLEASTQRMLFGTESAPIPSKSIEVVNDLDLWAATKQHLICGRPFNEPVRDPKWIRAHYRGPVGKVNYPEDLIREKMTQSAKNWDSNSATQRKNSRMIAKIK